MVKKCKVRKENLYLSENQLSRNEMWCVVDNHNCMCHISAKGFLDSNYNQAVIQKNQFFKLSKLPQISHIP